MRIINIKISNDKFHVLKYCCTEKKAYYTFMANMPL